MLKRGVTDRGTLHARDPGDEVHAQGEPGEQRKQALAAR
jgi:hypothetical protein